MSTQSPMTVFKTAAPQVAQAFDGLIQAISQNGGLDAKTRQLIYIGIKASQGDTAAVTAHTPMVKSAGASREELRDAILLTLAVSGVKGVVSCLPAALDAYDHL